MVGDDVLGRFFYATGNAKHINNVDQTFRIGHVSTQGVNTGVDVGDKNLQLKLLREVQNDLDEWSTREGERVWNG